MLPILELLLTEVKNNLKRMKVKFLTALFVACSLNAFAQVKKYLSMELGGANGLFGISYDSRFNNNEKFGYKIRLGYGYEYHDGVRHCYLSPVMAPSPLDEETINTFTLPVNMYYLLGKENNFFETGLGLCAFYADYKNKDDKGLGYFSFGRIAYRHESLNKRMVFSIGLDLPFYTPESGLTYSLAFVPSITFGYKLFKGNE